jgi:PTH1 family peptidyl-tRNA hydrolase
VLGHEDYARLRFGIGASEKFGNQVDYVLGEWFPEEKEVLPSLLKKSADAIISFGMVGIDRTMTLFNARS